MTIEEKTLKYFHEYMIWIKANKEVDNISNYVYWYKSVRSNRA